MKKYTRKALILGTILTINLNLSGDNLSNSLDQYFNRAKNYVSSHPSLYGGNPSKRLEKLTNQRNTIFNAHLKDLKKSEGAEKYIVKLKDYIEKLEAESQKTKRALKSCTIKMEIYEGVENAK